MLGSVGLAAAGFGGAALFADAAVAGSTSFGEMIFSADNMTGAIAENVTLRATTLTFDNFTIGSSEGGSLLGPARQILNFAQGQGATTLQFTGTFSNGSLAAQFGSRLGQTFTFTSPATRAGLLNLLGRL